MKKMYFVFFIVLYSTCLFSQNKPDSQLIPANSQLLNLKEVTINDFHSKTLSCIDTLRYPQVKEQVLGAPTFYSIEFWQVDQEGISQTFLLSGATIGVQGIDFFGRAVPLSAVPLTVTGSIYNVDLNNNPTTLIGSATTVITDTIWGYRQILLSTPITVSGNYAVVIEPTSMNGKLNLYVNNALPGQVWDENLSRAKSTYYAAGQGWVSLPVYTSTFPGGPYDFEALLAPMITYSIETNFTATPNPVCMGDQVTFTSTTTPMSVLTNRMYNYRAFNSYFLAYTDSLFAWDPDETAPPFIYNSSVINFTYSNSGVANAFLATIGGFWNLCIDSKINPVTVNPLPTVNLTLTPDLVCDYTTPFMLAGGNPSGGNYSGTGVSAGQFDPSAAGIGTHVITYSYTDGNTCSNSATDNIVVDACTQITTEETEKLFISPNPATDYLSINIETITNEPVSITIFSPDGKIIWSDLSSESHYFSTIDLTGFAGGIYLVSVKTQKKAQNTKIVILK
jgi:hypothetical protein